MPLIYRPEHNITAYGLEKLHSFDSAKYAKIWKELEQKGYLKRDQCLKTRKVTKEMLKEAHSLKYLKSLKKSVNVAKICEFAPIAAIPRVLVKQKLLTPMLYHVGGTIVAAEAALVYGWAINLGGGMHHASSTRGGGWCVYSDIPMALNRLFKEGKISQAMIIDLDVHQGNGFERDQLDGKICKNREAVFIVDAFNEQTYPRDHLAKRAINISVPLPRGTTDEVYLPAVKEALEEAFGAFQPDLVMYNAGTDILDGDPLGGFHVSSGGVTKRDEMVFEACISRGIPIAMVTSGGYSKNSADVIASSIMNLFDKLQLREIAAGNVRMWQNSCAND